MGFLRVAFNGSYLTKACKLGFPKFFSTSCQAWKKKKLATPADSLSSLSSDELITEALKLSQGGDNLILEVTAGAGGNEAALFASQLVSLYEKYIGWRGDWKLELLDIDKNDLGGVRFYSADVSASDAYSFLKYECGVHRVQRVPETERYGRIHTSTVAVAVLPKPKDISVILKPKDLIVETCRASGPGGQHANKTDSAVRVVHKPTGIAAECQEGRSQTKNRTRAMEKLAAKINETMLEKNSAILGSARKLQLGSAARSEKIRTYNYPNDRISDHRYKIQLKDIKGFLSGGAKYHEYLERCIEMDLEAEMESEG